MRRRKEGGGGRGGAGGAATKTKTPQRNVGKKTISQRKNLPIECAQGDQPLRCPNRVV